MSIQMQLWSIQGDRPVRLPSAKLELEARLERWICQDLSLVGEDLLLLGSQVSTAFGHAIDILALDRDGNLVVLELKRGQEIARGEGYDLADVLKEADFLLLRP